MKEGRTKRDRVMPLSVDRLGEQSVEREETLASNRSNNGGEYKETNKKKRLTQKPKKNEPALSEGIL